jgi:hypothetical protein
MTLSACLSCIRAIILDLVRIILPRFGSEDIVLLRLNSARTASCLSSSLTTDS